jgi:hypothetical protein
MWACVPGQFSPLKRGCFGCVSVSAARSALLPGMRSRGGLIRDQRAVSALVVLAERVPSPGRPLQPAGSLLPPPRLGSRPGATGRPGRPPPRGGGATAPWAVASGLRPPAGPLGGPWAWRGLLRGSSRLAARDGRRRAACPHPAGAGFVPASPPAGPPSWLPPPPSPRPALRCARSPGLKRPGLPPPHPLSAAGPAAPPRRAAAACFPPRGFLSLRRCRGRCAAAALLASRLRLRRRPLGPGRPKP